MQMQCRQGPHLALIKSNESFLQAEQEPAEAALRFPGCHLWQNATYLSEKASWLPPMKPLQFTDSHRHAVGCKHLRYSACARSHMSRLGGL